MKLFLLLLFLWGSLSATELPLGPQPQPTLRVESNGTHYLDWQGIEGRTYFMQCSTDLEDWFYFDTFEVGTGDPISYFFIPSAGSTIFLRLRYTDIQVTNPGEADFDLDGYTNLYEIEHNMDPFQFNLGGAPGIPIGATPIPSGASVPTPGTEYQLLILTFSNGTTELKTIDMDVNLNIIGINGQAGGAFPLPIAIKSNDPDPFRIFVMFTSVTPILQGEVRLKLIEYQKYDPGSGPNPPNPAPPAVEKVVDWPELILSPVQQNPFFEIEEEISGTQPVRDLLPVEVAPEVLTVNSDFDEGRIDPASGYAIPDCDDVPNVDRKTGAGNGELRIDTEREHLNKLWANDERVTDDMHKGWFGLRTTQMDDDFWDGAEVTISKLDKIDPDTGRKENGQVRFYAKWGDPKFGSYYGIEPYKINIAENGAVSYTANNLVTSGVNGKAGEGVYGSSSTIPDNAQFWMEGVRPGKITLEWRLQKGDIDVKHEQTFLVCTQQSKQKWLEELTYMIRLQTQDDPFGNISIMSLPALPDPKESYGGEVDVSVSPTKAAGYGSNVERASEYYDFYEQTWNQNNSLSWSGLAKVVGAQVISGISDAQWGIRAQPGFIDLGGWLSSFPKADIEDFQLELFSGGEAIFKDIAWQHHAYLASGIGALEFVHETQKVVVPDIPDDVLAGWKLIDEGGETGDATKILDGSVEVARYEQNTVIVETYTNLDAIGGGGLVNAMSALAVNPVQGGDHFRDVAGIGAQLSNTAQRWTWVTAGLTGFGNPGKKGVLKAWESLTQAQKDGYANEDLRVGARRFSVPWILTTVDAAYLPDADIQVWDHLDQPGKQ